jgi:[ribosomal protein S5]-alanine N-acetyltransferase
MKKSNAKPPAKTPVISRPAAPKPAAPKPPAPAPPAAPAPPPKGRMLETAVLFLMPATQAMLDAAVSNNMGVLTSLLGGVNVEPGWSQFPDALRWMRDYLRANPTADSWWSYFIVHGRDARLIGTCGYKGAPSAKGEVAIGYEIAPRYQNQGLATEASKALIDNAFLYPSVKFIVAQTLPQENASTAVLRKLGFTFVGENFDLNDGKIWDWRLAKPTPIV